MSYRLNPIVQAVTPSPIGESKDWITGREFPADKPLLDVAQAVPGYPPADSLIEHLAGLLARPATSLYTGIFGMPELRGALASHMSDAYGGRVVAGQVAITAGCNQGFCAVMTAIAQPGHEVILPLPYYFNHQMWLEIQGIRPVHMLFSEDNNTVPPASAAAELITPRTRAIALVTPNNPTGAVYPPEVIHDFYELAKTHGLALVLDETYKDFIDAAGPPHALFQDPDWPETLVQLYSFSKAYCLTGYRVGSVICGPELAGEFAKIQDCIAICAPRIGQEAALYGLLHLADWREQKAGLMSERARSLSEAFRASNELRYELVSVGAYFAYVKHPFRGKPAIEVAKRLVDEQNVLCLPGSTFGPGQEDYLRVAFANLETAQIGTLLERLVDSLATES